MPSRVRHLAAVIAIFTTSEAFSQSMDLRAQQLDLITKTADGICGIVKTAGNYQGVKVKGDVKAQLSGLFKQLADCSPSALLRQSEGLPEGRISGSS
jgi:hypothetical protein